MVAYSREAPARMVGVGVAGRGDVVGQRVDPDIHDVPRRARDRHTPVEAGPRHGQVRQPALDEAHHLVAAALRPNEVGIAVDDSGENRGIQVGHGPTDEVFVLVDGIRYHLGVDAGYHPRDEVLVVCQLRGQPAQRAIQLAHDNLLRD